MDFDVAFAGELFCLLADREKDDNQLFAVYSICT
jgi:hypothetical protein